jgi:hypothetical protein
MTCKEYGLYLLLSGSPGGGALAPAADGNLVMEPASSSLVDAADRRGSPSSRAGMINGAAGCDCFYSCTHVVALHSALFHLLYLWLCGMDIQARNKEQVGWQRNEQLGPSFPALGLMQTGGCLWVWRMREREKVYRQHERRGWPHSAMKRSRKLSSLSLHTSRLPNME